MRSISAPTGRRVAADKQAYGRAPTKRAEPARRRRPAPTARAEPIDRWLDSLVAGVPAGRPLPADFSRADVYEDHD